MTSTEEAVAALSKSVHQLDNARRVGWAKSYEAEGRISDIERDLAVARGDSAVLARLGGVLWGFILEMEGGSAPEPLKAILNIRAVTSMLQQNALNAGREAAIRHVETLPSEARLERIAKAEESVSRMEDALSKKEALSRKLMRAARNAEFCNLMKRYGFESAADMKAWLGLYRTRNQQGSGNDAP